MKKDTVPGMIVDTCSLLRPEGQRFVRLNAEQQGYRILLPLLVHNELTRFARSHDKLKYMAAGALSQLHAARIPCLNRIGRFANADDEIMGYCSSPENSPLYVCTEDKGLSKRIAVVNPVVRCLTAAQLSSLFGYEKQVTL